MARHIKYLIGLIILINLNACGSLSYYLEQSIPGHVSLMLKMEEIETLIETDIDPTLKARLTTVLQVRDYASEQLLLPQNDSYRYYADIERPYVTWNVTAAPEFSLQAKTWCYFIIGCASYRGYFNPDDANIEADKLRIEGLDVSIGEATAYSTLGFFTDPVLNTMMKWRDYQLAGIIFHELSHQVLYIKNDTSFNEAFATSVQLIGLISWMIQNEPEKLDDYLVSLKRAEQFRELKTMTRTKLKDLYKNDIAEDDKRKQKAAIFDEMKQRYQELKTEWGTGSYDSWFDKPLNNARLLADAAYWKYVPAFLALYFDSEYNWKTFYEKCEQLSELEKQERDKQLETYSKQNITLPDVMNLLKKRATI